MITFVEKKDKDIMEKCCAKFDYTCRFFTIENNETTLQVEIEWSKGVDIPAKYAYHLGRDVQMEVFERMMNKIL